MVMSSLPHQNEIKAVLDVGFPPDCVVYAQPCKQISHIQYAANVGVRMMTFDSELELYKMKAHLSHYKVSTVVSSSKSFPLVILCCVWTASALYLYIDASHPVSIPFLNAVTACMHVVSKC